MHDYTAWKVHEDRLRELTQEGDASRLAAIAREAAPVRGRRSVLRRWLPSWLSVPASAIRFGDRSRRGAESILARRAR